MGAYGSPGASLRAFREFLPRRSGLEEAGGLVAKQPESRVKARPVDVIGRGVRREVIGDEIVQ